VAERLPLSALLSMPLHAFALAAVALSPALRILSQDGFVERGSGRGRRARLTDKGAAELELYRTLPGAIEARFFAGLRPGLESLLERGLDLPRDHRAGELERLRAAQGARQHERALERGQHRDRQLARALTRDPGGLMALRSR
jgi:DNA-binding MarR family transcriptional regulator